MLLLTSNNRLKNISILNESLMKLSKGEEKNKLTNIFQIHCFFARWVYLATYLFCSIAKGKWKQVTRLVTFMSDIILLPAVALRKFLFRGFLLLLYFWHAHLVAKAPDVSIEFLNEQANQKIIIILNPFIYCTHKGWFCSSGFIFYSKMLYCKK